MAAHCAPKKYPKDFTAMDTIYSCAKFQALDKRLCNKMLSVFALKPCLGPLPLANPQIGPSVRQKRDALRLQHLLLNFLAPKSLVTAQSAVPVDYPMAGQPLRGVGIPPSVRAPHTADSLR